MKIHFLEKRIFFLVLFIFVFIFFGKFTFPLQNIALAQTQSTPTSITPTVVSSQTIHEDNDIEISILKTQLEDFKEYNKNLLSTVQWSIGIVITTLIVILGLNWFTTYNQYQKDIKEYKKDLEKTISDDTNKFQTILTSTINQKFDALNIRDEELIERHLSDMKYELNKLRIVQYESEANYWEARGVYANAVRSYVHMIDLDPNHPTIEYTLSSLEKAISKCGTKMIPSYIQEVEDAMKKTIARQKTLTEQVLIRLNENAAK